MEKRYEHKKYEKEIYKRWSESGALTPPPTAEAKSRGMEPYCIIMPPPNANDPLHVGHAMFVTIEDILVRYNRMLGKAVLWLPGTDHAGIETQYVFEKKLKKLGKSRFNFDRETLYQMIWDYVQENSGIAIQQMKQLGASADWSRLKFTLDKEVVDLVLSTFERMHEEGLVYRELKLVNYCVKCGTGYSDLEVRYRERNDPLYYVRYELVGGGEPVVVATVRPETIFADVAIAIHPRHDRAGELAGKQVVNPLTGKALPIVEDEAVELEFGTGMLKITPGHDQKDFDIGSRHNLPVVEAIGFDGKMTSVAGEYEGIRIEAARQRAVEKLEEKGLMEKVDKDYVHNVAGCYRCQSLIEPLPMAQFFIKVEGLTQMALKVLADGETQVHGAGHDKILKHWLSNLKDWNISRQIVWGIRMPIWYRIPDAENSKSQNPNDKLNPKSQILNSNADILVGFLDNKGKFVQGKIGELQDEYPFELIEKNLQTLTALKEAEYVVSRERPEKDGLWLQETDTFDTWFSSSQWPVVTLKTTQIEGDFDHYYPTAVMNTGYDILMFWVMRMMMMGIYLTGTTPFSQVYLHGLVRDEKGQKMSKSKGNAINPLDLVEKYGADALRMALVMSTTAGQDSAVGESKVRGMRNLANKVWNSTRFVKLNLANIEVEASACEQDGEFEKKLDEVVRKVTSDLDRLRIGQAAETVHNEFWHWFCDESIEEVKAGRLSPTLLRQGLLTFLTLLHPFMPFVTEACFEALGMKDEMLILRQWPELNSNLS